MDRVRDLIANFRSRFHEDATVYRAPGRVNLIGEHTDYNDGFVLPAAIDLSSAGWPSRSEAITPSDSTPRTSTKRWRQLLIT